MPGFVFLAPAHPPRSPLLCCRQVLPEPAMPEFTTLPLALLLVACAIVFVSGLVHGTLGFGFPMVATPLLALVTDVRSAILLTLLPTLAVNIPSILHGGRWRESIGTHWPLVPYILLGTVLGTQVLMVTDPGPFRLLLAGMIVLYLVPRRTGGQYLAQLARHRQLGYLLFGLAAGFSAGTVNVMVPLLVIFTLELGMATTAMVQLFNLCFMSGKVAQLATFGIAGVIDTSLLVGTLPLVAAAGVALWLGMRLRARIEAETYRRWLRHALALVAVLLCGQFLVDALVA
jgi:uncharacterized membrane protein YfcA